MTLEGTAGRRRDDARRPRRPAGSARWSARRASRSRRTSIDPTTAVAAVQRQRPGQAGADRRARRRDRRRPADRAVHHGGRARRRRARRAAARRRRRRDQFGLVLDKGSALTAPVTDGGRRPARRRHARRPRGAVAHRRRRRAGPRVTGARPTLARWVPVRAPAGAGRRTAARRARRSTARRARCRRSRSPPSRSLGARRRSPGWPRVQASFFDRDVALAVAARRSLEGLWLNIRVMAVSAVAHRRRRARRSRSRARCAARCSSRCARSRPATSTCSAGCR